MTKVSKTVQEKLENIFYRYYGDISYHVEKAIKDILKVVPKTHFTHKCEDEIAELKMRNAQLKSVNKYLTDELYEFNMVEHTHKRRSK